jgi:hypothetical protein
VEARPLIYRITRRFAGTYLCCLGNPGESINQSHASRTIWRERGREMDLVARPGWDQAFCIRNARSGVLDYIALACLLRFRGLVISANLIRFLFSYVRTIASPFGVFSLSLSRCFRLRLVSHFSFQVNQRRFYGDQVDPAIITIPVRRVTTSCKVDSNYPISSKNIRA